MIPEPVKIRADFKLTCYKFQGIDAIRAALMEGEKLSTNDIQIKVKNYKIFIKKIKNSSELFQVQFMSAVQQQ
jgi:translation initiation factor 2 alpha subunit (eIF-2alpha)